jgi:hypothetical protein
MVFLERLQEVGFALSGDARHPLTPRVVRILATGADALLGDLGVAHALGGLFISGLLRRASR